MKIIDKVSFTSNTYKNHVQFWKSFSVRSSAFVFRQTDAAKKDTRIQTETFVLSGESAEILRSLTRENDSTLFVCLLAGWGIVLNRYSGQSTVTVDSPLFTAGSPEEPVNSRVPLVLELRSDESLKKYLNQTQQTVKSAYLYQDYPLQLLNESQSETFLSSNIGFSYDRIHEAILDTQAYDLMIRLEKTATELQLHLTWREEAFETAFVYQSIRHLEQTLSYFTQLDTPLQKVEILTTHEKQQMRDWNATERDFPVTTIHELFEQAAEKYPQNIALVYGSTQLTYQQLNEQATQLAVQLRTQYNLTPDTIVGLMVDRSERMILGLLAIVKAGAAYLPIDPTYPTDRIAYMLEDAGVKLLLTESELLFNLPAYEGELFALDVAQPLPSGRPEREFGGEVCVEGLVAYVIYTSGSTGKPKGVQVAHQGHVNMALSQIEQFGITASDVVIQFASLSFDASISEIGMALYTGATLVLVDKKTIQDSQAMLAYLREHHVTVATFPPSYLHMFSPEDLSFLRVIITAGEAAQAADALAFSRVVSYFNAYGPTEYSVCVSIHQVTEADAGKTSISIGKPIANTQVHILDEEGHIVPAGIPGELCVSGAGLARGYLNQPELTRQKFVPHPYLNGPRMYKTGDLARWTLDGNLAFLGRKDEQLKLRGYRIEPGEVAAVLSQHPAVYEAVVMKGLADELVAVVVPASKLADSLLEQLRQKGIADAQTVLQLPNGLFVFQKNGFETRFLFEEIFEHQVYVHGGISLLPGATIVDVGANIGMFSLYAGLHLHGAKIYAFEPVEDIYQLLAANVTLHQLPVQTFQLGLSDKEEQVRFHYYPNNTAFSGRYQEEENDKQIVRQTILNWKEGEGYMSDASVEQLVEERVASQEVVCQMRRLSDVMREEGIEKIDLLKIDVEKSEWDVLNGIDPDDWQKIDQIAIEIHDQQGRGVVEMEAFLKEKGFQVKAEADTTLKDTGLYNLYAVRKVATQTAPETPDASTQVYLPQSYASEQALVDALLQQARHQLPDYMVPAMIRVVDHIPLSPNGKVDKKALLQTFETVQSTYVAPRTEAEQQVAAIWQSALGREKVSITDNFFAIGGDSIKGIQIISRIYKAGLKASLQDLFQYPQLSDFALCLKEATLVIDQSPVTGELPLTPIQADFFAKNLRVPHHFNQAILLSNSERYDTEALQAVFTALIAHHDVLRVCFPQKDGQVTPFTHDSAQAISIERYLLDASETQPLEAIANALQRSIDLEAGPLVKIAHVQLPDADRLLVVVHHLVIDTVSWRILSEDLETLFEQYKQGEPLKLPLKTNAFKTWAEGLQTYARSEAFTQEIPYWKAIVSQKTESLPVDREADNSRKDIAHLSFSLSVEQTQQLLTQVNTAFKTEINDVLLTALGLAYARTFGKNQLFVNLEGHGREDILPEVDISRTVGWFTCDYPILLDLSYAHNLTRQLKEVKEYLRHIPHKGIGYGIWKYLTDEGQNLTTHMPRPDIAFNYLGQFDEDLSQMSGEMAQESAGDNMDPEEKRFFALEIAGMVANRKLDMQMAYSQEQFFPATIATFLGHYKEALLELIDLCSSCTTPEPTPSDFTYKELSIDTFEQLASRYAIEDFYPLSPMQEGMLFQSLFDQQSSAYFDQTSYQIRGQLNAEWVEKGLNALFVRHQVLRTVFVHDLPGRLLQVVLKERTAVFSYEDIRSMPVDQQEQYVKTYQSNDLKRSFDLSSDVLLRVAMIQREDNLYEFIWSHHHILMDGWCIRILIAEFMEFYNSYYTHKPHQLLPVEPYRTYIQWLEQRRQSHQTDQAHDYWAAYLDGYQTTAVVPRMKALNIPTHPDKNKQVFVHFDKEKTDLVVSLAATRGVTVNTVIQSLWGILLSRYNHTQDVVFGTVVSGRPSEMAGVESMIGLFINTIPVRIRYQANQTFGQLLQQSQENTIASDRYQYQPLADIQALSPLKKNLIDHLLVFENYPVAEKIEGIMAETLAEQDGANLEILKKEVHDQSHYDFTILFGLHTHLILKLEYTDAYDTSFIESIARHFSYLMDQVLANPDARIASLDLLTEAEKTHLLTDFATAQSDYPHDQSIHALFEAQAAQTPDATAVVYQDIRLTYQQLDCEATKLAQHLQSQYTIQPGDPIGILTDRSEKYIIAMLAILKAGGCYVPIDPTYPKERIQTILDDTQPKVVLTNLASPQPASLPLTPSWGGGTNRLPNLRSVRLWRSRGLTPPPQEGAGGRLSYIMYTSGSTGKPKGVQVLHQNVVRLVKNTNYIRLNHTLKLVQTGALSFDAATFEIWGMLLNGGELHLLPQTQLLQPDALKTYIADHGITTMWFTSSWFNQLVDLDITLFAPLQQLLVGGEKLSPAHVNRVRAAYPSLQVINGYGPTENTTFSICYPIEETFEVSIPLGKPIANSSVYILDAHMQPVPVGIDGEIYLGGDGLAKGYLNQPELTAEKFIKNPFVAGQRLYRTGDRGKWLPDGKVEFIGRTDEQVKIRGYRIEPGEIAHVLKQQAGVQDVRVQVVPSATGEATLWAIVIPAPNSIPDAVSDLCAVDENGNLTQPEAFLQYLKTAAETYLPTYMIPSQIRLVAAFPLTEHGKVDLKKLLMLDEYYSQTTDSYVPPTNALEQTLVEIWQEILNKPQIGIHDHFFEIGGHSLKAIQVVTQVAKQLNTKIDLKTIFASPTIARLAEQIRQGIHQAFAAIPLAAPKPCYDLSFAQRRLWLICQRKEENVTYNMPGTLILHGNLQIEAFTQAFDALVARHESLRTTFGLVDGEPKQFIHPAESFGLTLQQGDLRTAADREVLISKLSEQEASTPFDLETGPLVRVKLFQLDQARHLLLFTMHHIISDKQSLDILVHDFLTLYDAFCLGQDNPLEPLRIHYKDFAEWHNAQMDTATLNPHQQYWLQQFSGALPVLNLPTDFPRPAVKTTHGKIMRFALPLAVSEGIQTLAQQQTGSLYMVMQASLLALLYRYTHQEDIVLGSPISGREHLDLDHQIGYYLNTLALRTQFSAQDTFLTLLANVKENTLNAYSHQLYPFDRLVTELDVLWDRSRNLLFDVGFNLNIEEEVTLHDTHAFGSIDITTLSVDFGTAKTDLWFNIHIRKDGIQLAVEYNMDLFRDTFMEALMVNYQFLLERILENPSVILQDLAEQTDTHHTQFLQSRQQALANKNLDALLGMGI